MQNTASNHGSVIFAGSNAIVANPISKRKKMNQCDKTSCYWSL